jgi:hypothetical protein
MFGAVTLVVPSGFDAYARICHSARDIDGRLVDWAEVAKATGLTAHPLMQWHALVGSSDPDNFKGSLWDGEVPSRGNLPCQLVEGLCGVLKNHTKASVQCFFGLWIGWAWIEQGTVLTKMEHESNHFAATTELVPPAFSADEIDRARLKLPGRDYVLLAGPLSAATEIYAPAVPLCLGFQSPNIFWPPDHSWFVASEIDFDSTLVGGSADLIRAILAAPGLDAWPVGPDDSLAADADKINRVLGARD